MSKINIYIGCRGIPFQEACELARRDYIEAADAEDWARTAAAEAGLIEAADGYYCPRHHPDSRGVEVAAGPEYVAVPGSGWEIRMARGAQGWAHVELRPVAAERVGD